MTDKATKRRRSIKLANEVDVKDFETVIVTGGVPAICKETFSETVKALSSGETKAEFQDTLSNAAK